MRVEKRNRKSVRYDSFLLEKRRFEIRVESAHLFFFLILERKNQFERRDRTLWHEKNEKKSKIFFSIPLKSLPRMRFRFDRFERAKFTYDGSHRNRYRDCSVTGCSKRSRWPRFFTWFIKRSICLSFSAPDRPLPPDHVLLPCSSTVYWSSSPSVGVNNAIRQAVVVVVVFFFFNSLLGIKNRCPWTK